MTLYKIRAKLYFAPNAYLRQCFENKVNLDNIYDGKVISYKPIEIH